MKLVAWVFRECFYVTLENVWGKGGGLTCI